MSQNHQPQPIHWLMLAFLSIVWGSSFILMKKGLVAFSGVQVGSLRMAIAFFAFLPVAIKKLKKVPKESLKYIAIVGFIGSFFPAYLFAIAETKLDSAPTGILNSTVPLFTFVSGILFFGQQFSKNRLLGVLLGLFGAVVIMYDPASNFGFNSYSLLVIIATILYGFSSNTAKHHLSRVKPIQIASIGFFIVGIPSLIILFTSNFIDVMQTHQYAWQSLGFVAILSLVGTALALILFWKLIHETDAIFGSLTTYLIPIVAIGWGLLDGEKIGWWQYVGFVLILISVILVKSKAPKKN